jgi:hypothetical protein
MNAIRGSFESQRRIMRYLIAFGCTIVLLPDNAILPVRAARPESLRKT